MYLRYPNLLDAAVFKHLLRRIFPEEPEIPTLVDTWSDIGRSVSQEELSGRGRGRWTVAARYKLAQWTIAEIPRRVPGSFAKCPSRDSRGGESTQQVLRQNELASTVRSIRGGVDVLLSRSAPRNRRRYLAASPRAMHLSSRNFDSRRMSPRSWIE